MTGDSKVKVAGIPFEITLVFSLEQEKAIKVLEDLRASGYRDDNLSVNLFQIHYGLLLISVNKY